MDKLRDFIDSYGGTELARQLNVSKSTVSSWRHGRFRVPPERCIPLERLSGGKIKRYDIRPDIFGPAPATSTEAA